MKKYLITVPIIILALTGIYFLGQMGYTKLTAESRKNAAIVSALNSLCQGPWNLEPYFAAATSTSPQIPTTKLAIFSCSGGEDLILK